MSFSPEQEQQWDQEVDLDLEREAQDREFVDDEPVDTGDDFMEPGEDPMENAGPPSPDGMGPQGRTPSPDGMGPQGHDGQQMTGPHDARDPGLAPDAPHQFWAQDSPHVQDALNKYLMPQLQNPNPEIAQKAQRILMEGPHAE
jgi:hypothetical protein